jgi:hypothetical protein
MERYIFLVKDMLKSLFQWNLTATIEKYEFHKDSIKLLDYIISKDDIAMSEDKVTAIRS